MTNNKLVLKASPEGLIRGNKTQGLSRAILDALLQSGARPGDRLPTEHELADVFGVSRPTVRQAMKSLEAAGLVESKPRRGAVLCRPDMRSLAPWFGAHLALALASIEDQPDTPDQVAVVGALAEARWVLERSVAPLACARHTEEDIAAMKRTEDDFKAATDSKDDAAAVVADAAFHRAYVDAAHNPVLFGVAELIDGYFEASLRLRALAPDVRKSIEVSRDRTLREHRTIRKAMMNDDSDRVCKLLDKHLRRPLKVLRRKV